MPYNQYAVTDHNAQGYSNDAASIPYDPNYMMAPQGGISASANMSVNMPTALPSNVSASIQPPSVQAINYSPYSQPYNQPANTSNNMPVHNQPPAPAVAPPKPAAKLPVGTKAAKFDLLSELDNVPIPAPTLQPIKFDLKPEVVAPKVDAAPIITPKP